MFCLLVNFLVLNVAYAPCSSIVLSITVMSCECVYVFMCRSAFPHVSCFTCQDVGGLVGTPRFLCVSVSRPTFGFSLPGDLWMCVFECHMPGGMPPFRCDATVKDVSQFVIRIDIIPCSP